MRLNLLSSNYAYGIVNEVNENTEYQCTELSLKMLDDYNRSYHAMNSFGLGIHDKSPEKCPLLLCI